MTQYDARGFNIGRFIANAKAVGHLRSHDFIAVIPYPTGMRRNDAGLQEAERTLELSCDTVNFPSTGTMTYKVQRYGYGALETNPVLNKFSPIQCTFYCDEETNIHKFFHEWIKITANYDFYDGIQSAAGTTIGGHAAVPYEIGYKHEYCVDMYIKMFDEYGHEVRNIRFREAFPIDVGDIVLGWSRMNDIVKIPVTFTFVDWSDMQLHGQNI